MTAGLARIGCPTIDDGADSIMAGAIHQSNGAPPASADSTAHEGALAARSELRGCMSPARSRRARPAELTAFQKGPPLAAQILEALPLSRRRAKLCIYGGGTVTRIV